MLFKLRADGDVRDDDSALVSMRSEIGGSNEL